ncbi:MAG: FG-GAP repeat protein, partial [Myxococcaceae bacterium]
DSNATGVNGNHADNSAPSSGAVYVFTRSAGAWSQQAYLKASNAGSGDWFGRSLALASDGSTLAVGSYWEDSSATGINGSQANNSAAESGAVYVFTRSAAQRQLLLPGSDNYTSLS